MSLATFDDGSISALSPRRPRISATRLQVGGPARAVAYVGFLIEHLTTPPPRVVLLVKAVGGVNGSRVTVRSAGSAGWSTLTSGTGVRLGRILRGRQRVQHGWLRVNVTPFVRRNGLYIFALTADASRVLRFVAGAAGLPQAPRLIFAASEWSTTRAPGSQVLTDQQAALRVRAAAEIRAGNFETNHTTPSKAQLARFRAASTEAYSSRVTGDFAGTTDEIIQWAALKWGIDEDLMRAVAVQESDWHQSEVSDGGVTFGIFSVKTQLAGVDGWAGTYPLAAESTAFNADYYGRAFRACLDGKDTWLGPRYHKGDVWGCVGLWYSGSFHDASADQYALSVQGWLARHPWTRPGY